MNKTFAYVLIIFGAFIMLQLSIFLFNYNTVAGALFGVIMGFGLIYFIIKTISSK